MLRILLVAVLGWLPAAASAETFLYMYEEHGCSWCERWDSEISGIYPKTSEGRAAPLRRVDIHQDMPSDVNLTSRVHFTPTFVLVRNGKEISRIEGYPGEDFFWGLLAMMLGDAGIDLDETG